MEMALVAGHPVLLFRSVDGAAEACLGGFSGKSAALRQAGTTVGGGTVKNRHQLNRDFTNDVPRLLEQAREAHWPQLQLIRQFADPESRTRVLNLSGQAFLISALSRLSTDDIARSAQLNNIESLYLVGFQLDLNEAQALTALFPNLRTLALCDPTSIGPDGLNEVVSSFAQLETLKLIGAQLANDDAKAITASSVKLKTFEFQYKGPGGEAINDSGIEAFIASFPRLETLRLSYCNLENSGAKAIATSLPQLKALDLSHSNISDCGAKAIAKSLSELDTLNLSGTSIRIDGIDAIVQSLPKLETLKAAQVGFGKDRVGSMMSRHHDSATPDERKIGDQAAEIIAASCPKLKTLDLGKNWGSDAGAKIIATWLLGLSELKLSSKHVTDEGVKAIAASLSQLETLDLSGNHMGNEGAKALAASLPLLETLDLSGNRIGDEGAKALAASLPDLETPDLGNCQISDDGAKAIAASPSTLQVLDLCNNQIGSDGCREIVQLQPHLNKLMLDGNCIGDEGAKAIDALLRELDTLDLHDNQIGDEGAKTLI